MEDEAYTGLRVELCPHCGAEMEYSLEKEDWVCAKCGYIGLVPEDSMDYVLPG